MNKKLLCAVLVGGAVLLSSEFAAAASQRTDVVQEKAAVAEMLASPAAKAVKVGSYQSISIDFFLANIGALEKQALLTSDAAAAIRAKVQHISDNTRTVSAVLVQGGLVKGVAYTAPKAQKSSGVGEAKAETVNPCTSVYAQTNFQDYEMMCTTWM